MSRDPMSCERLREMIVEDDPPREAMRAHAEDCEACARMLRSEERLHEAVTAWRDSTPDAPARLRAAVIEHGVRTAAGRDRVGSGSGGELVRFPRLRWTVGALAAAATLTIAALAGLGVPDLLRTEVVSVRGGLLVDDALAQARAAEREHAEAIARLAAAAEPVLARADDPATPPAEAAKLRALADRLASIDEAIRDVRRFLDTNPGHPSARTTLLAAYMDKTDLLGEILASRPTEEA